MTTQWSSTDATVASVQKTHSQAGPVYSVMFTYTVEGTGYNGAFTTMRPYQKDQRFAIQYDRAAPQRTNLSKREGILRWAYVLFFTLLAVMAIYFFLHSGRK